MISQGHGNLLLVGTIRNCILQGTMELEFAPVVEVSFHTTGSGCSKLTMSLVNISLKF